MPIDWSINTQWESISKEDLHEGATLCSLTIRAKGELLTQAFDLLAESVRDAPLVSAYPLALWFLTHWWRLRWEPRKSSIDWQLAHRMKSIGGGYLWPNVEICSDGERIGFIAKPMHQQPVSALRYISEGTYNISAQDFEVVLDEFVEKTIHRLQFCQADASTLEALRDCIAEERQTPELCRWRKLEAMLGKEPDEMLDAVRKALEQEAGDLGFDAIGELADASSAAAPETLIEQLGDLRDLSSGSPSCHFLPLHTVSRDLNSSSTRGLLPWQQGASAAQAVRAAQDLNTNAPVSDRALEDMLGCPAQSLLSTEQAQNDCRLEGSFILHDACNETGKMMLRSTYYPENRRFEAARLLGDHLLFDRENERLRPATKSVTHRQKMQRAFASELLCPFEALDDMMAGNYESERLQEKAANHFQVAKMVIRTQLVNHAKLDRELIVD